VDFHCLPPILGKKRITEVTRQDVAKLHHARRDTPTEATREATAATVAGKIAQDMKNAALRFNARVAGCPR
jgi:hypothetical protein